MLSEKDVFIVGAGTYGEAMFELAELIGYSVKGFYDEDKNKIKNAIMTTEVIGKFSELSTSDIYNKQFIVAIGNNKIRHTIMNNIIHAGGVTPTLIHPSAVISPTAQIGRGVYIQAQVNIWTKVEIDDFCILSPNVVIAHHTSIGKACLISTLSGVGASINIEDQVFIGMGATIVTGVNSIGHNTVIGAGSTVLKNIEKNSVYVGSPAKKIKNVSNN